MFQNSLKILFHLNERYAVAVFIGKYISLPEKIACKASNSLFNINNIYVYLLWKKNNRLTRCVQRRRLWWCWLLPRFAGLAEQKKTTLHTSLSIELISLIIYAKGNFVMRRPKMPVSHLQKSQSFLDAIICKYRLCERKPSPPRYRASMMHVMRF